MAPVHLRAGILWYSVASMVFTSLLVARMRGSTGLGGSYNA